jgi:hypothetical protein
LWCFRAAPVQAATLDAFASGETQSPIDGLTFAETTVGGANPRIVAIHDEQDGNLADVHYEVNILGDGSATFGRLSGEFQAQAENGGPFSTSLARAVGIVRLSFSDTAVVGSPTLAVGTPVTVTFRVDMSGSVFLTPGARSFPDNGASIGFEGRVTDPTSGLTTARFSGVDPVFVGPAMQTMTIATQIGRSLELTGKLDVAASVRINDNFTNMPIIRTGAANGSGRLYFVPTGDLTLVSESGHNYSVPSALAADFDDDGDVDAADFTRWRDAYSLTALGDADEDGDSDGADYLVWQRQLGGAPIAAAQAGVPEPTALVIVLAASAAALGCRRPLGRRIVATTT